MKKEGEITVFFSMILLCVFGLLCVMVEAVRTAGAGYYLQTAAGSSIDSLFSEYHRALWEEYHLLGLEYTTETELEKRLEPYLTPYLNLKNWYPWTVEEIEAKEVKRLTDEAGIYLEREIMDYMKYGIWNQLDLRPEQGAEMGMQIKEAIGMQKLADSYSRQGKEAWKLEQSLQNIYGCLENQNNYYEEAGKDLAEESADFLRAAGKLKKEVKKIPGLVGAYERQADRLTEKVKEMEAQMAESKEDLSDSMKGAMTEELNQYQSYIQETGSKREEIKALVPAGDKNLEVIMRTVEAVEEIQDYLDSLEGEDTDNSSSMWAEAEEIWRQFETSRLAKRTEKDEEKKQWLEEIEDMVNTGILELLLPEGEEASQAVLNLEGAPSGTDDRKGETDKHNPVTRVLTGEYCAMHFTGFTSDKISEGPRYEMEYLIGGKGTDRENLTEAAERILAVRTGLNLIHILSDSQKRGEAGALALTITGAAGLTPFSEIIKFFIMNVWAMGEGVADVRALLAGEKVPLIKTGRDWNLSLNQLLELGRNRQKPQSGGGKQGFSYEGYLKLLLLSEPSERKYFRIMDLIQMNLRKKQKDFQMETCAYRVDIKINACGKHIFFALPFVENLTGSGQHGYLKEVKAEKAY